MKNTNVSKIKLDKLYTEQTLSEKIDMMRETICDIAKALEMDLSSIDSDNFSQYGIGQIKKIIDEQTKDLREKINTLGD